MYTSHYNTVTGGQWGLNPTGARLVDSDHNIVQGTLMVTGADYGIYSTNGEYNQYLNNTIKGSDRAICLQTCDNSDIKDNEFVNDDEGVYLRMSDNIRYI